jgi:hypothetical protein
MTPDSHEPNAGAASPGASAARARGVERALLEQHVEWQGFAFSVPNDWEIVRHGLSPALGSLCFVDRRQQRLSFSWAAVRSVPDLERLAVEMAAELSVRGPTEAFKMGSWRGLTLEADGGSETRAVSHHLETSRLLELRVSAPAGNGQTLARDIARSFRARHAADERRRWRAFGLDVSTPQGFVLVSAAVAPCDVTFCFEREASGRKQPLLRFSARRLGMAEAWFRGDFARLLAAKASGVQHGALEVIDMGGHEAHVAKGRCVQARWVRLLGRAREERALVWSEPDQNAIYLLRSEGPLGAAPDPREFVLPEAGVGSEPA